MSRAALTAVITALMLTGTLAACVTDNPAREPALLDAAFFSCEVQPVLDRECAFPACHGTPTRPFSVFSPGRMRMDGEYAIARAITPHADLEAGSYPALTAVEHRANLASALGFARADGDVHASQLLSRPLYGAAGGRYHAPAADVFTTRNAPGYQAIERWLQGETAPEPCP